MLFDNIKRSELKSDSPSESIFRDINQYDWPGATHIRNTMESWFENYPLQHRTDLRERFRSDDDQNHEGAFFELFLHELLNRLGFSLKVHPEIAGTMARPDFLVSRDHLRFYLEATVSGQRSGPFTRNRNEEDVIDKLNTLTHSKFGITVHMEGTLSRTLSRKNVLRPFKELLESHDPDDVQRLIDENGSDAAPSARIEGGDWRLKGWLWPISPGKQRSDSGRQLVIGHHRGAFTDCATPVRNALKEKAQKYRNLDAPLVLAVNARDMFYNGRYCDMEVLLGKEHLLYSNKNPDLPPALDRKRNGFWSCGRHSRIDAVLIFSKVDMWNVYNASACAYLNPYNTSAALPDSLFRLPYAKGCNGKMKWFDGEHVAALVGVGLN